MEPLRIILYSHDSVGLGHVRRNPALTLALANQLPGLIRCPVTGILITGTALGPAFAAPTCWEWVLLPGMSKSAGRYGPGNLTIPAAELIELRSNLLDSVLSGCRLDLVIIDRHPTGTGRELALPLRHLCAAATCRFLLPPCDHLALTDAIGGLSLPDDPGPATARAARALIEQDYDSRKQALRLQLLTAQRTEAA